MERYLVDVSPIAADAGFIWPVYLTPEVWNRCVEWDDQDSERQEYQEQDARLWDLLFVPATRLANGSGEVSQEGGLPFQINCLIRDRSSSSSESESVRLHAIPIENDGDLVVLITF